MNISFYLVIICLNYCLLDCWLFGISFNNSNDDYFNCTLFNVSTCELCDLGYFSNKCK
jgi:hypothetical protein